jgi:hypothetical protein
LARHQVSIASICASASGPMSKRISDDEARR